MTYSVLSCKLAIYISTINSIPISVNNSIFTSDFFKAACHGNQGAERNFAGSK